jgi:hypothetical protein
MRPSSTLLALLLPAAASAQTAAVFYDSDYVASGPAIARAGLTQTLHWNDGPGFQAAAAAADLVVVETWAAPWPPEVGAAVAAAVADGKAVILHHWAYDTDPAASALLSTLDIRRVGYGLPASDLYGTSYYRFFDSLGGNLYGGSPLTGRDTAGFEYGVSWPPPVSNAASTTYFWMFGNIVVNDGLTIVNGHHPYDYRYTDTNSNGIPDGEDVIESQVAYLMNRLYGLSFTMRHTGCAPTEFFFRNGTPGGRFAVLRASEVGAALVPAGRCAGVRTGLDALDLRVARIATFDGAGSAYGYAGSGTLCSVYFQLLDLTTCEISLVAGN